MKEFLIAIDMDADLLSKIDFETGSTVLNYYLGNSCLFFTIFSASTCYKQV